MAFPLLRLPLLASTKIIKYIDAEHLIFLIQLSTRARTLVKLSKVHIELTILESSIQFQKLAGQGMVKELEFFNVSKKPPKNLSFKPPCDQKFETINQYQVGAYKKMIDDFVEFFKVCSVSFELETTSSDISYDYMKYTKILGLKFSAARVMIGGAHGEFYQALLEVCSSASQLLLHFDTERFFNFQGFNEYKMHKFRFVPKDRGFTWFTTYHMCELMNCTEVSVEKLNWRDADFNIVLKVWMAGDGNLKSWKLWARRACITPWLVMYGIKCRELGHSTYEIQRADGVKAEVALSFSSCTLKVIDA